MRQLREQFFFRALGRAVLLLLLPGILPAQDSEQHGFVDRVYRDDQGAHKYVVFLPENYTPEKKWPVILFLHGAGERGTDGRQQLQAGLGPAVKQRTETFPFIVVFPQAEKRDGRPLTGWAADSPDGKRALEILNEVEEDYSVDEEREILTGWSMGAYGTWSLGTAHPERFAALVPVSGGGEVSWASKLTEISIWAFHGADDQVIRPEESHKMIDAIRDAGGQARYTEVPQAGHDVWQIVYDNDILYEWMRQPRTAAISTAALQVQPGRRPKLQADADQPFHPAVKIPQAVSLRLGNEALKALSYSIPHRTPADALTGQVADISDSTVAQGRVFSVYFSGIYYSAELVRAELEAYRPGRLNVQLALQDVNLTISRTDVTGESRSAVAGPIQIVIGSQGPVWLSFDVRPVVRNRQIELELLATRFDIPWNNWYVTSPAWVSTQGLGMTEERVSNGLVSGLYESQGRIEQQVSSAVPPLLEQLEGELNLARLNHLVGSFWPLPVYQPRVRVWPSAAAVDEDGVSLVLGMTAAAVDPEAAPQKPRSVPPVGSSLQEIPRQRDLQVGLAAEILEPLSQQLIEADVARIHVADIPIESAAFRNFLDREKLAAAIPDLKRYGKNVEIWAELILQKPLSIEPVSPEEERHLGFKVPQAVISLAVKKPASSEWRPYAEFLFRIEQPARLKLLEPDYTTRLVETEWFGTPTIEAQGRFAPSYQPSNPAIDMSRIRTWFTDGWQAWTHAGPASKITVPDVDFGYSKLRATNVGFSPPNIHMGFGPAGVKLSNQAQEPLNYQTKGPYSDWGGPYTLPPGESHEFDIAYPLTFRRRIDGQQRRYTLPAGSHSEFRVPIKGGPPQLFQARRQQ